MDWRKSTRSSGSYACIEVAEATPGLAPEELAAMQLRASAFATHHGITVNLEDFQRFTAPATRAIGTDPRADYTRQLSSHMMGMLPDTIEGSAG